MEETPPTCEIVAEILSRHLDDLASPEERASAMRHLRCCEDCHELWSSFVSLHSRLELARPAAPPTDLTGRIMARIEAQQKSTPAAEAPFRPILPGRAVAVLVAASIIFAVGIRSSGLWQMIPHAALASAAAGLGSTAASAAATLARATWLLVVPLQNWVSGIVLLGSAVLGLLSLRLWVFMVCRWSHPSALSLQNGGDL